MYARLAAALALACAAVAQTPAFEVASIKISEPITPQLVQSGRLKIGVSIDSQTFRATHYSLYDLITLAYQVKPHQLSGPGWMSTERYEIQAKLPEGARRGEIPEMLQTLLAERFGLRTHREMREMNVLALVVASGGHHLKPSTIEDAPDTGQIRGGIAVGAGGASTSSSPSGDSKVTPGAGGNLHVENKRMTMAGFSDYIYRYCEYPVINMTGVEGTYAMEFDVSGEEVRNAARSHGVVIPPTAADTPSEPPPASLASSLRRLGLKLEGRKAPIDIIVVDKVEKIPTEN